MTNEALGCSPDEVVHFPYFPNHYEYLGCQGLDECEDACTPFGQGRCDIFTVSPPILSGTRFKIANGPVKYKCIDPNNNPNNERYGRIKIYKPIDNSVLVRTVENTDNPHYYFEYKPSARSGLWELTRATREPTASPSETPTEIPSPSPTNNPTASPMYVTNLI